MACACNFASTIRHLVAELGHLPWVGDVVRLRLSPHGSHGSFLEPPQLICGVDRIIIGLVLHLLAHILCNVAGRVVSPFDQREHDMILCTPNSCKNPRAATSSPGDDDSADNNCQKNPGDSTDEEKHEQQHGDRTEDPVQRNER